MSDAKEPELGDKQTPAGNERYPTQCPSCQQHSAKPKSASTVPGQPLTVRLEMLCGHCAYQWTHDKIDEKPE